MGHRETVLAQPGSFEILVEREFDAPCELVFRAHVDPEIFSKWYGCHAMSTRIERFESQTGGSYRFFQRIGSEPEGACHGMFHEVAVASRIVKTVESAENPGRVCLETTRFEAKAANRTRVTKQLLFQSLRDRDQMVEFGVGRFHLS